MALLYPTTKQGNSKGRHRHFLLEVNGEHFLSEAEDHLHGLQQIGSDIEQTDGVGQAVPGINVVILPAPDGHTHKPKPKEVIFDTGVIKVPDDDPETVKHKLRRQYYTSKKRQEDNTTRGIENYYLYSGDHWYMLSSEDKAEKEKNKTPMLTLNEIGKYVKLMVGFMRQKRFDIRYMPVEGSDELIADVASHLFKVDSKNSNLEILQNAVIRDQCVTGRGNLHIFADNEDDVRGEIKFDFAEWQQVYFGEHKKQDASDCPFVINSKWFTEDELRTKYPEHQEDITKTITLLKDFDDESRERYDRVDKYVLNLGDEQGAVSDYFDNTKNEYNLLEAWERRFLPIQTIYPLDENVRAQFNIEPKLTEKEKDQLLTINLGVVDRRKKYIKHYILIGADLLVKNEIYPFTFLPIFPAYYDKLGDSQLTLVDALKDPNLELNKRVSTVADILNKIPVKTRFIDDKTFRNPSEENEFLQNAHDPKKVFKVKDLAHLPVETTSATFPGQIVEYSAYMKSLGADLVNLNLDFIGEKGQNVSGVALMRRELQSFMGNENVPDNFFFTMREVARAYLEMAFKIYSPARVIALLEDNIKADQTGRGITLGNKEFKNQFTRDEKLDIMSRWEQARDTVKYDVSVTESAYSPNMKLANFMLMVELTNAGRLQMPPLVFIELAPIPYREKQELKKMIQEQQKLDVALQAGKQNKEIEKVDKSGQYKMANTVLQSLLKEDLSKRGIQGGASN